MNGSRRFKRWMLVTLVACVAVAACAPPADKPPNDQAKPQAQAGVTIEADLKKIHELPDFMFLERAGKPLSRKDMLGRVWVAAFIFTRCQTHCVWMTQEMQKFQKEFAQDADFRMVSTSVDPTWDTPEVLTRFAMDYGVDTSRWFFLTGERDAIRKFAMEGCLVQWPEDEVLAHSLRFTLVDRDGVMRGSYHLKDEGRMAKLRKDIRVLLDEKKNP